MPNTPSTNLRFLLQATNNPGWGGVANGIFAALDAMAALGGSLAVAPKDVDLTTGLPTSLDVQVSAGSFRQGGGAVVAYAGTAARTMTASATNYVYLTDAGVLTVNTTGFPTGVPSVPLAVVVAGGTTITSVTDARRPWSSSGLSRLQVKEGANAAMGVATLVAGTVTVSTTLVTANSRVFLTGQVDGGTPGWLRVSARTAGTSFTVTSSNAADTSTVAWLIVEPG